MLARPINSSAFTVYNSSTSISGTEINTLVSAMNTELAALSKVWGRTQIPVLVGTGNPTIEKTPANAWPIYIVDDLDMGKRSGALSFHSVQNGIPYARIYVKEIKKQGGVNLFKDAKTRSVASVVFQEIVDMFGDCFANGWSQDSYGDFWALELADPVDSNIIVTNVISMKKVDNKMEQTQTPVALADYVYPAWFNSGSVSGPYNRAGNLVKPFQVDKHGYAIVYNGNSYSTIYGDNASDVTKARALADLMDMRYPSRRV
jgi:hypothetical protein